MFTWVDPQGRPKQDEQAEDASQAARAAAAAATVSSIDEREGVEGRRAAIVALWEATFECVIVLDSQGRILTFNPAAERAFGHRAASVVGWPVVDVLVPQRDRDGHPLTRLSAVAGTALDARVARATGDAADVLIAVAAAAWRPDVAYVLYIRERDREVARGSKTVAGA